MGMLQSVDVGDLSPAKLWSRLDPETRQLAARSYFSHAWSEPGARREAEIAIARALRFREEGVRKLPVDKRVGYLARAVKPDDSLAGALLLALHLEHRRALLGDFLDALHIPHQDGTISEDHVLAPQDPHALEAAVQAVAQAHPPEAVDLYLVSLLALDRDTWSGLAPVLERRRGAM
jgi:hypothetical protein